MHHSSSHLVLIGSGPGLELFHLCLPNTALQVETQAKDDDIWSDYMDNGDGDENGNEKNFEKDSLSQKGIHAKVFIAPAATSYWLNPEATSVGLQLFYLCVPDTALQVEIQTKSVDG